MSTNSIPPLNVEAPTVRAATSTETSYDVSTIRTVFRANRALTIGLPLAGALLGLLLGLSRTTQFTATTTIEVSRQTDTPLAAGSLNGLPQQFSSGEEMTADLLTEQSELQSATVAFGVIEQLNLIAVAPYNSVVKGAPSFASLGPKDREKILGMFRSHLKAAIVKDTKLIDISFTDANPQRAALVANTVVDTYLYSYAKLRTDAAFSSTRSLGQQLDGLKQEVSNADNAVSTFKENNGLLGGQADTTSNNSGVPMLADNASTDRLVELNKDLTAAQVARIAKEAVNDSAQTGSVDAILGMASNGSVGGLALNAESSDLSLLAILRQQASQVDIQIAEKSGLYGVRSPQIMGLTSQKATIERQISQQISRIRIIAAGDLKLARANEDGLRALVEQQQDIVIHEGLQSNKLALMEQEAAGKRKVYNDLYAKHQEAEIAGSLNPANVAIVDPARPPIKATSPNILQNMLVGFIVGALAGIFLALLNDFRKYGSPEDRWTARTPDRAYSSVALIFLTMVGLAATPRMQAQVFPNVPANLDQTSPPSGKVLVNPSSGLTNIPVDITNGPLEPGYQIHVEVFGAPEMSSSLRIDSKGDVTVPYVGLVHIGGLTPAQAQDVIVHAFTRAQILVDPQLTVDVQQYTTTAVTVLGEVQTPGRVQLVGSRTLQDVIAMAGGETTTASGTVIVERPGQEPSIISAEPGTNTEKLLDFKVHDGDTVVLRRAGVVYVMGAVTRPGGYVMVDGGKLNVLEAVTLAQGSTLVASLGSVYVIRPGENGQYTKINLAYREMERGRKPLFVLQARDILYIPTSKGRSIIVDGSYLIGSSISAVLYRASF